MGVLVVLCSCDTSTLNTHKHRLATLLMETDVGAMQPKAADDAYPDGNGTVSSIEDGCPDNLPSSFPPTPYTPPFALLPHHPLTPHTPPLILLSH